MSEVKISDRAAQQILINLQKEPSGSFLRLEVLGGGCSGFQYRFVFDTNALDDDSVFSHDNGVVVRVDPASLELLKGSVIDYKEDMIGSAFVVENPNADVSCGCGNSFSV